MPRESSTKLSKREQIKRSNKKSESDRKQKKNQTSDSDYSDESESDDEVDMHEFRKYVQKIFPSKHMEKKIKAGEKLKKIVDDEKPKKNKKVVESESEEEWETESDNESKKKRHTKKQPQKRKRIETSDDETVSLGSEDTSDDDYEDEYDDEIENEEDNKNGKSKKLNIIFTIGGANEEEDEWDDYDDDYDENEDDVETEDEDEEVSTDESDEDIESDEDYEDIPKKKTKQHNNNKPLIKDDSHNEVLMKLKELLQTNPNDKSIKKCIETYEADIMQETRKREKKEKKQKAKNMRIFKKIINDKNSMNDFTFYEKLEMENQKKLIKELREINKITRIEKPYRMTLLEADIPIHFKSAAFKKVNSLRYMEPGSGEFYKIKNWVDTFMKIPFTSYKSLPISIENGVESCHDFMYNAQKTLDNAVYGLNDAKMQIMQMLGQLLTNPKAIGTAIAIHGPPGTGKTSLVKEGISKILNRPFAFIALGGATDSSFLEGHSYTYEGSSWGKIVQILIDSKCMNPVIYFDELDKISDTPRGEEIAGILTHLTDTSQNSQFHDKYFAEIDFDLSKCLFIFSYNDESKVNPILRDRMYRIKTKGYSGKEKTAIANNYLLPKIREQVKFSDCDIIIPDDVLSYINETHCNKEDGVRNLKRCLEIVHTKLNLYRLMKPGSNLFEGEMTLKVEFPFKVTKDVVDKLIKKEDDSMSRYIRDTLYV
jgi:ATP-dependent Lon protease